MIETTVDVRAEWWPDMVADVAAAVGRRAAAVRADVYEVIVREIPELREDKPLLALLASSVDSNVDTCLQIMEHRIDLAAVQAPAAAAEYARRLAQRGTPLTALLRAYRVGHACFSDWLLRELARQAGDAGMITATTLAMSRIVAGYIDQTSEAMVAAYGQERENWLRNRSTVRAARIRDLLSGERVEVSAAEAALGYRLRQYHVGLVCWAGDATGGADEITRLECAIGQLAARAACCGDPAFLPRDEASAWAWLPLGAQARFGSAARSSTASARPRRASAGRWARTASTWNSRCGPPAGSARPCSTRGPGTRCRLAEDAGRQDSGTVPSGDRAPGADTPPDNTGGKT